MQRPKSTLEVEFPQFFRAKDKFEKLREPISDWWVACDLGTTGVELCAVDKEGPWASVSGYNRQIVWGSDVMTRLEFAQKNGVT
jgi:uncharacterized 2Fe-2S/4Fe-4S cluster protein (DUF4445 family)